MKKSALVLIIFSCLIFSGCRGWNSEKPPIHPNINFDFQPKVKAQRDPRPIPANTQQFQVNKEKTRLSNYTIDEAFVKNGQKKL